MAVETAANYKDSSTAQNLPIDGIIRTVSPTTPTAGQSVRQVVTIGDGSDTGNYAEVSSTGAMQTWKYASTAALTQVPASATSVTLLASNANRKSMVVVNTSANTMYVAFAATASASAFTYQLGAGQVLQPMFNYQGQITAIWAGTGGYAVITEMT